MKQPNGHQNLSSICLSLPAAPAPAKSSLIKALSQCRVHFTPDAGRAILRDQVNIGGTGYEISRSATDADKQWLHALLRDHYVLGPPPD